MTRCRAQAPDLWTVECELTDGHTGQHRNNQVVWTLPQTVYVGGEIPDPTINTDHWHNGAVRLSWDEPAL